VLLVQFCFSGRGDVETRQGHRVSKPISKLCNGLQLLLFNEFFVVRYWSLDGKLEAQTVSTLRWIQIILLMSGVALWKLKNKIVEIVDRLIKRRVHTGEIGGQTILPVEDGLQ
jgi:hypothetical protein